MTERAYITVDRAESPRLVQIADPGLGGSDEIILQDLHDTLNSNILSAGDPDDSLDNMDDDFLIDSAGKEELGGGVLVGITSTLQNAQLAFSGNYTTSQTGTATSADPLGETLTDTAATFEANGVSRGDWLVNFSDKSVTEVLRVLSEIALEHRPLQSGSGDDWDIGDDYAIFAIIQKEVSGGNLVAIDDIGDPVSPIFPSFATQVVRTASSSATLQEQADIQYASFGGGVSIDALSSYSGTLYPIGTPRQPVNNMTDAMAIAGDRGFTTLFVIGDLTLDVNCVCHGYSLIGESASKTLITIDITSDVEHAEFSSATITGVLDGGNLLTNCTLEDLLFVDGTVERCILTGMITLSSVQNAHFLDCWSGAPGLGTPIIDMGGSGSALGLRNYNGGITLRNKTGPEPISIDLNSGQIILDDTIAMGDIVLRGVGTWTNKDTYAGGATVIDQLLSSDSIVDTLNESTYDGTTFSDLLQDLLSMASGRIEESPAGTFTFFERDNTTPRFILTKLGTVRSRT